MTDLDNAYSVKTSKWPTTRTLLLMLTSIVALSIGGWIYVIGRPETHIYNIWHGGMASTPVVSLPDFVLYCLPDGLWSLSSILMLHALLCNEPLRRRIAIVAVVPLLGIVSELLQAVGWVPGVFDVYDLACYAIPLLTYLFSQSFHNFFKS